MPRTLNRLTAGKVTKAQPGMHSDGGGLYLQVTATGRSWIFRYNVNGRDRQMGLGSTNTVDLKEAREKALEQRKLRDKGLDPIDTKRTQQAAQAATQAKVLTFDQAVADYAAAHAAGWRSPRHAYDWQNSLRVYASPVLGKLDVKAINTELVLRVLRPHWQTKTETMSRVRSRIEVVVNFAIDDADRANPARWKGHLEHKLDKRLRKVKGVQHFAALPYEKMYDFMTQLRAQTTMGHRALEFCILTAARTMEAIGAKWCEVDLERKLWVIPKERMKSHREHRVPLSDAAVELLGRKGHNDDYVFPGDRSDHVTVCLMLKLLHKMGADCTVHGFRSTFRTWAAECTSHPREVIEMCLAHQVGDATERAYQRGDQLERRHKLMNHWADFCGKPN